MGSKLSKGKDEGNEKEQQEGNDGKSVGNDFVAMVSYFQC